MRGTKSPSSRRLEIAASEVEALIRSMEDFASLEGLGDLDILPESAELVIPEIVSGQMSDATLKKRLRDLLAIARFGAQTALYSIRENKHRDAAGAFPNVLDAAHTYGIVQSVVVAWNGGVEKLVEGALAANRQEIQRGANLSLGVQRKTREGRSNVVQVHREADRLMGQGVAPHELSKRIQKSTGLGSTTVYKALSTHKGYKNMRTIPQAAGGVQES